MTTDPESPRPSVMVPDDAEFLVFEGHCPDCAGHLEPHRAEGWSAAGYCAACDWLWRARDDAVQATRIRVEGGDVASSEFEIRAKFRMGGSELRVFQGDVLARQHRRG